MAKEKTKGRVKWKTRSTRPNSEALSQKRKKAKELYRKKKRCWLERKVEEIEQTNRRNYSRKFYKYIKRYSNPTSKNLMVIKGEQGELIIEKEEILTRLKDFFTNLLNIPQPISN
jgi:hypothetical protein